MSSSLESENEALKARVKELEAEIKMWHDTLDGTVHSTCHVMRLMEKVMRESDD
jgi:cell division protein FtsB